MPPKKGAAVTGPKEGFVFIEFGPTSEKCRIFNTDCTSSYLYDQIKEVAFTTAEAYARSKDAELRQELAQLSQLLNTHKRVEPRRDSVDEPADAKLQETAAAENPGDPEPDAEAPPPDPFDVEHGYWQAEKDRLDALVMLREKQVKPPCCWSGCLRH